MDLFCIVSKMLAEKMSIFLPPVNVYLTPCSLGILQLTGLWFQQKKLEKQGYQADKKFVDFDTIHEPNRHADRWTEIGRPFLVLCIAPYGQNFYHHFSQRP